MTQPVQLVSRFTAPLEPRLSRSSYPILGTVPSVRCRRRCFPTWDVRMSADGIVANPLDCIRKAGVVACLRTDCGERALECARAALDGNITVLEVTMTTPLADEVIEILVKEYPSALIGAGTVLSWQDAEKALAAGAKFLFSPVALEEVITRSREKSVLFIPGGMTPTEVVTAFNWGAKAVKLYPAAIGSGVQLVKAVRSALPHIPLIVSSGITLDMLESYLKAGAIAAILSDAIFDKSAVVTRDYKLISQRARTVAKKASFLVHSQHGL